MPFFVALLAVFASTFFPSKPKPKSRRDVQANPADEDVMIEYDDEALASLKENSSEMVVMMFVGGKVRARRFSSAYAPSFWREPILSFGTVNIARPGPWADFARSIGALPGSVIVWHAHRKKFKNIGAGDGSIPHPLVCSKIEIILDGAVKWGEAAWPEQTNADSTD